MKAFSIFIALILISSLCPRYANSQTDSCSNNLAADTSSLNCDAVWTAQDYILREPENVFQKILGNNEMTISKSSPESEVSRTSLVARRRTRRFLGGPGSWPPRCMSKCGRCSPCKPVHVPVPPGTPVTTEYYPEAWRCKCGNRLFMP